MSKMASDIKESIHNHITYEHCGKAWSKAWLLGSIGAAATFFWLCYIKMPNSRSSITLFGSGQVNSRLWRSALAKTGATFSATS